MGQLITFVCFAAASAFGYFIGRKTFGKKNADK